ncbi:SH2 domain containing 3Cb [Thalassophryne amazonica]|uniref:SH2 domain containing 3Cb n=1 Tax=Thalassophryne amazonica TaxID=390379 RepID=UPI00147111F2|nr:SH2 domain containing 3Cb [Thalassophryne amazonica]
MNKRKPSFKWFGSLTNVSFRHQSEKNNTKAVADQDDELYNCATTAQPSLDDMEACRRGPSYACSSDMYTHVGTVPRRGKQKKGFRTLKGKKNKEEEEEEEGRNGRLSQCQTGEHVRNSPLLSALSSLHRPGCVSVQARPLPDTPMEARYSPLPSVVTVGDQETPLTCKDALETDRTLEEVSNNNSTLKATSTQELYVPMDPISETSLHGIDRQPERPRDITSTQKNGKSVNGFQEEKGFNSKPDMTYGSGEYVKFCKEKFWLEPPTEKLVTQLEEELKLSSSNLRSHAWYHGCIPWEVSESLVVNQGDFLVRDSQSSRGHFVLTSHWDKKTRHFLIKKSVVKSGEVYTRVHYSLEGDTFDSIPALVQFYVGSRVALSRGSGTQIHQPVNRTLPLSYLEMTFCKAASTLSSHSVSNNGSTGELDLIRPSSPSSRHHKEAVNHTIFHQPVLTAEGSSLSTPNSNRSESGSPYNSLPASVAASPALSRCAGASQLLPSSNSTFQIPLPPKILASQHSDTDGNCYTELYPGPQSYVERLREEEGSARGNPLVAKDGNMYFSPVVETASSFRPRTYQSPLMPKENKPLEVCILRRVKELLAEVDPKTAAKHITKADCKVARILEVSPEMQRMMGVSSGMELLTLPHGQQLRQDLLERFHTMAITLAVNVLGCTGSTEERAGLLLKMIQIAAELKSNMGNMFGFAAIMRALELPQVSRLEQTWTVLRQRHTEGAILYEKTLRPFMKNLNAGRESCTLSNTTFPHIVPLLSLLEKSMAFGEGVEPFQMEEVGLDVVMFHLGAGRTIAQLGGICCSNADCKLQGFREQDEFLELFLTDFQMRLLWGSRGAEERQVLRYAKFDQVLTALSTRLETPV